MTSDPSNYHRGYSSNGSYFLFQFKRSDVISALKKSTEYSFVFFKCSIIVYKVGRTHRPLGSNLIQIQFAG